MYGDAVPAMSADELVPVGFDPPISLATDRFHLRSLTWPI
jgi:hypothetical protein